MKQSIQLKLCREAGVSTTPQHSRKTVSPDCSEAIQTFDEGGIESAALIPREIRNIVSFPTPLKAEKEEKVDRLVQEKWRTQVKMEDESASLWFLQHTDGTVLTKTEVADLRRETKLVWQDLGDTHSHIGAPWRDIPAFFQQTFYKHIESKFFFLQLCENHYKADAIAFADFSHWLGVMKKAFKYNELDEDDEFEEELGNKNDTTYNRVHSHITHHRLAWLFKRRTHIMSTSLSPSQNSQPDAQCAVETPPPIVISNDDRTDVTGQEASPSTNSQLVAQSAVDAPPANEISIDDTTKEVHQYHNTRRKYEIIMCFALEDTVHLLLKEQRALLKRVVHVKRIT
ncbi:hypothetical protein EI94DRAFT_1701346 [Lactarius quietus]|nr:hypothetical protein EI94DRAFT_1701346 [Lactarius quietus]